MADTQLSQRVDGEGESKGMSSTSMRGMEILEQLNELGRARRGKDKSQKLPQEEGPLERQFPLWLLPISSKG